MFAVRCFSRLFAELMESMIHSMLPQWSIRCKKAIIATVEGRNCWTPCENNLPFSYNWKIRLTFITKNRFSVILEVVLGITLNPIIMAERYLMKRVVRAKQLDPQIDIRTLYWASLYMMGVMIKILGLFLKDLYPLFIQSIFCRLALKRLKKSYLNWNRKFYITHLLQFRWLVLVTKRKCETYYRNFLKTLVDLSVDVIGRLICLNPGYSIADKQRK